MSITATSNSQPRELIPAGNYVARCYSMVHIGTIMEEYMGQPKLLNKIRVTWELPTELRTFSEDKGEQPMVISKEYTLSTHEKSNLRKDLESWRGKAFTDLEAEAFDVSKLLGKSCMLSIIHKTAQSSGNDYDFISSVAAVPKGLECPAQVNPTFEFNYEDKFTVEAVESMPDFIKEKIKDSNEYKKIIQPAAAESSEEVPPHTENDAPPAEDEVDDLPF